MTELDALLMLDAQLAKQAQDDPNNDNWIPACGGTEVPFYSRSGRKLLYVWQPSTGDHAYLDCGTDMLLTHEEHMLYIEGKL